MPPERAPHKTVIFLPAQLTCVPPRPRARPVSCKQRQTMYVRKSRRPAARTSTDEALTRGPVTRRVMYAQAICSNRASSRDDLRLAVAIVEKDARRVRQVFGESHPMYETAIKLPALARAVLASHEAQATS